MKAKYDLSAANGMQNLALDVPTSRQDDDDDDEQALTPEESDVGSLSLLENSLQDELDVANAIVKGVGDLFMEKNTDSLRGVVDKVIALNGGMKDGSYYLDGLERPDKVSWGTFLKHCEGTLLKDDGVLEDLKPALIRTEEVACQLGSPPIVTKIAGGGR